MRILIKIPLRARLIHPTPAKRLHHTRRPNRIQISQINRAVIRRADKALLAALGVDAGERVGAEEGVEACAGYLDVVAVGDGECPGGGAREAGAV